MHFWQRLHQTCIVFEFTGEIKFYLILKTVFKLPESGQQPLVLKENS